MKRIVLMIIPVLIYGIVFTSCSSKLESEEQELIEGKFSGEFTVKRFAGMPGYHWGSGNSWTATLVFNNGKYTITTGGSGNYSISNGKIIFEDENAWTSNFDSNLILNGIYEYTFDGKKLTISQRFDFAHYVYDLKKE
jgi:hypothetical protein